MTTWTIQKDGQDVRSLKLSDDDAMKVAGWAIAVRANSVVETPATDDAPAVMRDPTADEAIGFQAEDFFSSVLSNATKFYQDQAVVEAIASVDPITPVE